MVAIDMILQNTHRTKAVVETGFRCMNATYVVLHSLDNLEFINAKLTKIIEITKLVFNNISHMYALLQ